MNSLMLIAVATLTVTATPQATDAALAERLDTYFERLEPLGFSGVALVMKDGEVLLERGYGLAQRAQAVAMTTDTALPIGSISKHFTAAAVLRLVADSKLGLEMTLADVFDDVPAEKAAITLHQLLTHTSGLPGFNASSGGATTPDEYVRATLAADLAFAPGTDARYSNLGYGVLAAIVERAAEQPFEEYLRSAVLLPAGMKSTGITLPARDKHTIAHGYIDGHDEGPLDAGWSKTPWQLLGSGGIQTTLADMASWERALRSASVLDAETLALMYTPHVQHGPRFATGYGCGIETTERGTRSVGHDGSNDVFGADWRRYVDEGVMLFIATNDADVYAMDVAPVVEQIVFGGDVALPPELIELSPAELAAYAGNYRLENGGVITVVADSKGLVFSSSDVDAAKQLHPLPDRQEARRDELLEELPLAFELAFEGEFEALHALLDPYAPLDEFMGVQANQLERMTSERGAFESARALPGRNRFGEIGIALVLAFEQGELMIEYCFGPREIGSIRMLESLPARVLFPASETDFIDYDIETGATWALAFELDDEDQPVALLIAKDSGVVRAER